MSSGEQANSFRIPSRVPIIFALDSLAAGSQSAGVDLAVRVERAGSGNGLHPQPRRGTARRTGGRHRSRPV